MKFIERVAAFFALGILLGCSRDWPPKDVAEVRGYLYNLSSRGAPPIVTNGVLHKSVVDTNGVRLTGEQIDALVSASTGKHSQHEIALCYVPHHGYVFYDKAGGIAGWIEICFGCMQYRASSKHAPQTFDIEALRKLTVGLGIPVFEKESEYEELARKTKGGSESIQEPARFE